MAYKANPKGDDSGRKMIVKIVQIKDRELIFPNEFKSIPKMRYFP